MDTEIFLILAIGIFAGFFVQTVIGFAGSLIALPILLFKMELPDAIAYISIFYLFSSIFLILKEWRNIDRKIIVQLAIPSMPGIIVGIFVLTLAKPILLKRGLGVFILLYVAYALIGKRKIKLNKIGVLGFGVMAGFFSGIFSTGGPLYVICVENTVKNIRIFRATMIGVSGLIAITRVPGLAMGGILNFDHLKMALFIFPIFLFAQFLGKRTYMMIEEKVFNRSLMLLLCLAGMIMIF